MQLSLKKILFGALGDVFLISVSLNQVRLARCTWVRPSCAMGGERCSPWSISSQPAILHASLLSFSVLPSLGESAHTFKYNIIHHNFSFFLSAERKNCQLSLFVFAEEEKMWWGWHTASGRRITLWLSCLTWSIRLLWYASGHMPAGNCSQ